MKKYRHLCMALLTAASMTLTAEAEPESSYTVNFNTSINTSEHAFKVAPCWKHKVGKIVDTYGDIYYMSYTYRDTQGRDGSGALEIGKQEAGESSWDMSPVTDLLVTPVVSGDVTLYVKAKSSYNCKMTVYNISDDLTLGSQIALYDISASGDTKLSKTDWTAVTVHLDTPARIAYQGHNVLIDDFTATSAEIISEPSMKLATIVPSETTGTKKWDQLDDGSVVMTYTVTVTNDGPVALNPGDTNYSVSIINGKDDSVLGTTAVPYSLGVGDTSEPFDVVATITDVTSVWPNSYQSIKVFIRENLNGTSVKCADSGYNEYKSKFVFREAGTSATYSISETNTQNFGIISEAAAKSYEIYNDGVAPLTIKSVTIPDGFTADVVPAGGFTVASKGIKKVTITQPATAFGVFNGNLEIRYDNNGTDKTYSLPMSATVIAEGTWTADFNNTKSQPLWPEGSIAESGVNSDYNYRSGAYDVYLKSYASSGYATENNRFITPKLHAEAGDVMTFDVAYEDNTSAEQGLKVYISTDRQNWGDPIADIPCSTLTSSFQNKSITITEAGDYYVAFALWRVKLDNIVGLKKVEGISHDVFFKTIDVPDQKQSGQSFTPAVEIIPALGLTASDYSVKFYADGELKGEATSADVAASAKDTKRFVCTESWTPTVDATTVFNVYFQFEFNDGTILKSPVKTLKITNEPFFAFFDKGTSTGNYEPTNRVKPISFGRVNDLNLKQEFEIYNHGTAPLTVSSITVPAGFTASVSEATVAAKERQQVDITFSATQPGAYSGDLSIVWVDGNGANQTYTLAVNGELLDTTKWYGSFDNGTTTGEWPKGALFQKNISLSNGGSYSEPDVYATCSSSTDNMLISPKLHATAGETIAFNGCINNTSWTEGKIQVVAAATRDALASEETRTLLGSVCGDFEDEDTKMTTSWKTFSVAVPEAGDYYLGFIITGRAKLDEIYGLTVCDVAHDWIIEGSNIPATAMQNNLAKGSVTLRNVGLNNEEAGSYTVTAFVGDKPFVVESTPVLESQHSLASSVAPINFSFRSSQVGTFPVYVKIAAGDYEVATEPVDVTFTQEVAMSEVVVGTPTQDYTQNSLVNFWDKNSTAVVLYTPEELGLSGGERITQIKFRGTVAGNVTRNFTMYYEFTDDTEQTQPENGAYNVESMTKILDLTDHQFDEASEESDVLVIDLAEPIVYQSGKSLRLVSAANGNGYKRTKLVASTSNNGYGHSNDNQSTFESQAWSQTVVPVMYLKLQVDPKTLSGTVRNVDNTPAEGAVVRLVSNDADEIQYEATTDAEGKYTVNVIQSSRTYNVTASKDNTGDYTEEPLGFEESQVADFTLMLTQNITNENTSFVATPATILNVDMTWPAGINTVALPFGMTREQALEFFGANAQIHTLAGDNGNGINPVPTARFDLHTGDLEAGVPYLVYLTEDADAHFSAKGVELIATPGSAQTETVKFNGVFTTTPVADGMYVIDGCKVLTEDQPATGDSANNITATEVAPFHAYLEGANGLLLEGIHFNTGSGLRDDFGYATYNPVTVSGTVYNVDNTVAEGAVVRLTSDDTDSVQYEATSDSEGKYAVVVIDSSRAYNVTATKDDTRDYTEEAVTFSENKVLDFTLMLTQNITNENTSFVATPATILNVDMTWPAGINTVALPFDMTREQALEFFGDDAQIHILAGDNGQGTSTVPTAQFNLHTGDLEAGVPYLVYLSKAADAHFAAKGIELIAEPGSTQTETLKFSGVFTATPVETGMFVLDGCKVLLEGQPATGDNANNITATEVNPFHAYLAGANGVVLEGIHFNTDSGLRDDFGYVGIEGVNADQLGNSAIYNLQGIRVYNPSNGIYIVNGRKVYIRK